MNDPVMSERSRPVWPVVERALEVDSAEALARMTGLDRALEWQRAKGLAKYGVELHTYNGRDEMRALGEPTDIEQEAADLLMYAVREAMEARELGDPRRVVDRVCLLLDAVRGVLYAVTGVWR